MTLHLTDQGRVCVHCRTNPACGEGWDPGSCAECITARREHANEMLAELAAASDYRCACHTAARYPHLDWCGGCPIPAQARSDYLWQSR
jgi:hypothetical protein